MVNNKNAPDSNSMTNIIDVEKDDGVTHHLNVDLTEDDDGKDDLLMGEGTDVQNAMSTIVDGQLERTYKYANVSDWFNGKDIFMFDKIILPINIDNMHWIVAVIFTKKRRIQIYDSMGFDRVDYICLLYCYVHDEHQNKKGYTLPDADTWELIPTQQKMPLQKNGTLFSIPPYLDYVLYIFLIIHY